MHLCCHKCQDFIIFYCWLRFHYVCVLCVCVCHIFMHSPVDGLLGYFHILAVANNATMNIGVPVSFWIHVFGFFQINIQKSTCWVMWQLRDLHTAFHSGCINPQSHQQCLRLPFSLHPHQHLWFVDFFFMIAVVTGKVISHCGFNLLSIFSYLLTIYMPLFKIIYFYLHPRTFCHCFLEREEGREGKRSIDWLPPKHAPTRNRLGPDPQPRRVSWPRWSLQPLGL